MKEIGEPFELTSKECMHLNLIEKYRWPLLMLIPLVATVCVIKKANVIRRKRDQTNHSFSRDNSMTDIGSRSRASRVLEPPRFYNRRAVSLIEWDACSINLYTLGKPRSRSGTPWETTVGRWGQSQQYNAFPTNESHIYTTARLAGYELFSTRKGSDDCLLM